MADLSTLASSDEIVEEEVEIVDDFSDTSNLSDDELDRLSQRTDDDESSTAQTVTEDPSIVDTAKATAEDPKASAGLNPEPPSVEPPTIEEPFTFRADGKAHTLQNWKQVKGQGVIVPESEIPNLKQQLAAAHTHNNTWRVQQRQWTEKEQGYQRQLKQAEEETKSIALFFDSLRKMSPEERYLELEAFEQQIPKLALDIERKRIAAEREEVQRMRSNPQAVQQESFDPREFLSGSLDDSLEQFFSDPEFSVLSPEDRAEIREKWTGQLGDLIETAQEDYPDLGIAKGERVYSDRKLLKDLQWLAKQRKKTAQVATGVQSAVVKNERLLGTKEVKAPPTVAGGSSPAPKSSPQKNRAANRAEWKKRIGID